MKTECDYLFGWTEKQSHTQKSHQKWWTPEIWWESRRRKRKNGELLVCFRQIWIGQLHLFGPREQLACSPAMIFTCFKRQKSIADLGLYAPQGSTSLLPKLSMTSKVSARTSYAWVGSWVHFRSSEDITLLEFTSPVDREYMRRHRKFHWI